jgi:hypothetical protein
VVLDEVQDCSLLYQFVVYFIKTLCKSVQILLLGDYMQKIYEFGADCRFLTRAAEIWGGFSKLSSNEFVNCSLGRRIGSRTRYRIS